LHKFVQGIVGQVLTEGCFCGNIWKFELKLIQRGGGTGPMIPRQPLTQAGAKSGRGY